MSPSAHIRTKILKSGERRYEVRFRLGGRGSKLRSAGTFKTYRDAQTRQRFVIGEIAAGRDPLATLAALAFVEAPRTLRQDYQAWLTSRIDLDAKSVRAYGAHFRALPDWLLDKPTEAISWSHVRDAFGELSGRESRGVSPRQGRGGSGSRGGLSAVSRSLSPSTLQDYRQTLAQVFDYAGIEPNPARDRRFKLPRQETVKVVPPPGAHVLAMLERIAPHWRHSFVLMEQAGCRVEETLLTPWGDVDVLGNRILMAADRTKGRSRARWVQVPEWLMGLIADLCPPEDRAAERLVFFGTPAGLRTAMAAACRTAGIPHYSPHDLRHRRISLWHGQGIPWANIAERVGQTDLHTTANVYSHAMVDLTEIAAEQYLTVFTQ